LLTFATSEVFRAQRKQARREGAQSPRDEEPLDALAGVQAEALQTPLPLGDEPRDDSRKQAAFLEGSHSRRERTFTNATGKG
jgi:hypothetical protein